MTADVPTLLTDAFAYERLQGPAQTARHRTNTEWHDFARRLERDRARLKRTLGALCAICRQKGYPTFGAGALADDVLSSLEADK